MQREEIQAKAEKIIVESLGCAPSEVVPEANFVDDLGCDNLDIVELCMSFEEEFCVEIRDDEMNKVLTVAQALDLIESKAP